MATELDLLRQYWLPISVTVAAGVAGGFLLSRYTKKTDLREYDSLVSPGSAEEIPKGPTYIGSLRKVFAKHKDFL